MQTNKFEVETSNPGLQCDVCGCPVGVGEGGSWHLVINLTFYIRYLRAVHNLEFLNHTSFTLATQNFTSLFEGLLIDDFNIASIGTYI